MPRFPSKPVTGTDLKTGQVTHYPSMYAATKAIALRRGKRAASMLPGLSHVLDKPDRSAHGCRWTTTPKFTPESIESIEAMNAFGDALEKADAAEADVI